MKSVLRQIEEVVWYVFLFALPFQSRIILWQRDVQFNEWGAVFFYGTDILFVGLLLFWIFSFRGYSSHVVGYRLHDYLLMVFLMFAAFSIFQHEIFGLGAYQFLRLLQAVIFFWYIRGYAVGRFNLLVSLWAIVAGGVFQGIIAVAQFLRQSDLGLRVLGESVLSPTMQGVAVFYNFAGEKIMRAYGTLPHPNILAAYLLLSLFALYFLYLKESKKKRFQALGFAFYILLLFAFLMTFARTTIFVWLVALIALSAYFFYKQRELWICWKKLLLITAGVSVLFVAVFWQEVLARVLISSQEEAVQLRLFFNKEALGSGNGGLNVNWLGVGIGNFVSWFIENRPGLNPYLYQPVHNVYLLIYSELGIFGLLTFLGFIGSILFSYFRLKQKTSLSVSHLTLIICLLFIALFDHFPWTIQQGRLIFWGILGILSIDKSA